MATPTSNPATSDRTTSCRSNFAAGSESCFATRAIAIRLPKRAAANAAGLHILVEIRTTLSTDALIRAARERGVHLDSADACFTQARPDCPQILIGFASLSEPKMREGARRLARVLDEAPPALAGSRYDQPIRGR